MRNRRRSRFPARSQQPNLRELSDRFRTEIVQVREELTHLEPVAPSIWPRRVFHLLAGSIIPASILFAPYEWVQWGLIAACIVAVLVELGRGLLPAANEFAVRHLPFFKERELYEITGSTFLLLSSTVAFFVFDKEVVVLALVFVAVGDPLAALVGRWDPKFRVFEKSIVGTVAFVVGASAAGYLVTLHGDVSREWWLIPGAVAAAVTELLPIPVDDNIRIPLVAAGVMALLSFI